MNSISAADVDRYLLEMTRALRGMVGPDLGNAVMVGLQTGGYWVAERLHSMLELPTPLGSLSSHFYRDDFNTKGLHPKVKPSNVPVSVEDRVVILVDDVLFTGRTIRAAMNELFDHGRPRAIRLAVLIDRGGHELPVAADVVGKQIDVPRELHVKLSGPTPLQVDILERPL
jgi:pyrimidine operon attenuation protein/uracil phosphoribosyltransferase